MPHTLRPPARGGRGRRPQREKNACGLTTLEYNKRVIIVRIPPLISRLFCYYSRACPSLKPPPRGRPWRPVGKKAVCYPAVRAGRTRDIICPTYNLRTRTRKLNRSNLLLLVTPLVTPPSLSLSLAQIIATVGEDDAERPARTRTRQVGFGFSPPRNKQYPEGPIPILLFNVFQGWEALQVCRSGHQPTNSNGPVSG